MIQNALKTKDGQETQDLDISMRNQLIMDYAPLVSFIARRIAARLPASVEVDDLISSGFIGLMEAIKKFDPSRDTQFKTYGEWRIKGAILDELRNLDLVPRSVRDKIKAHDKVLNELEQKLGRSATSEEASKAMGLSADEYQQYKKNAQAPVSVSMTTYFHKSGSVVEMELPDERKPKNESEQTVLNKENANILKEVIASLPDQQSIVMTLYYYDGLTLKECADFLGLSESRVSQIRTLALKRMKRALTNIKFIDN